MTSWLKEPIKTQRLILRATEHGDEEWIIRNFTNPDVRRYLGGALSEEEAKATIQVFGEWWGHFSIIHQNNNRGIGCVSFEKKGELWELSYHMQPEYWHQGLATEAVTAALQWFFSLTSEDNVLAVTQTANVASCKLLEGLGAKISNEFTYRKGDNSAQVRQYTLARSMKALDIRKVVQFSVREEQHMDFKVLFVAGFGPITRDSLKPRHFYQSVLGIPLKERNGYLHTEELEGVKSFALWPLSQAAYSCFGTDSWPTSIPEPCAWIEFDVDNLEKATAKLLSEGYRLLVVNKKEPWGQTVTRLLGPDGLLVGVTVTPSMRQ